MIIGIDASRAALTRRTGTEAYAFHLIRALAPLAASRGHQLRLYFNQPPGDDLSGLPASEPVVLTQRRLWTHTRLNWELLRRPPDVFFTPAHVIPAGYYGRAVATVHDLGYRYFPDAHTRSQLAYLEWSTRHNARKAVRVIADSGATKVDLMSIYGVEPDKIDVVYPGADPQLGPVDDPDRLEEVCARYGISQPYILYLGTLQPRKNLVRLVEAFTFSHLAQHEAAPYMLVLAGKTGWLADDVLAAIAALPEPVRQRVVLPGFVAEEDKAALISAATMLAFPSLHEGFGFPVLEGHACGTPVVCSASSSLPAVAGEAAVFVDSLDAKSIAAGLLLVARYPSLREELVRLGYRNLDRFQWPEAAAKVLTILETAAKENAGREP